MSSNSNMIVFYCCFIYQDEIAIIDDEQVSKKQNTTSDVDSPAADTNADEENNKDVRKPLLLIFC